MNNPKEIILAIINNGRIIVPKTFDKSLRDVKYAQSVHRIIEAIIPAIQPYFHFIFFFNNFIFF
ncbi:MAG: hypothetical protein ACTSPQ_21715 [Candidatus Helarchaeota archaeon]